MYVLVIKIKLVVMTINLCRNNYLFGDHSVPLPSNTSSCAGNTNGHCVFVNIVPAPAINGNAVSASVVSSNVLSASNVGTTPGPPSSYHTV